MVFPADLSGNDGTFRLGDFPMEMQPVTGRLLFNAVKSPEEIQMPPAAAEFTIGNDRISQFL